jgi:hypothetical protein
MTRFYEDDQRAQALLDEAEDAVRRLNKRMARLRSSRRYNVLAYTARRRPAAPFRTAPWAYCPGCQRRISGAALDNATKVRLRTHGRFGEECEGSGQIVDRGTT